MESGDNGVKEPNRVEEKNADPRRVQEYEFFVDGDGGEAETVFPGDRNAKGIRGEKGKQNKSGIFFSSSEESDA